MYYLLIVHLLFLITFTFSTETNSTEKDSKKLYLDNKSTFEGVCSAKKKNECDKGNVKFLDEFMTWSNSTDDHLAVRPTRYGLGVVTSKHIKKGDTVMKVLPENFISVDRAFKVYLGEFPMKV